MAYDFEVFRYQYVQVSEFVWHLWQYRALEKNLTPKAREIQFLQLSSAASQRRGHKVGESFRRLQREDALDTPVGEEI